MYLSYNHLCGLLTITGPLLKFCQCLLPTNPFAKAIPGLDHQSSEHEELVQTQTCIYKAHLCVLYVSFTSFKKAWKKEAGPEYPNVHTSRAAPHSCLILPLSSVCLLYTAALTCGTKHLNVDDELMLLMTKVLQICSRNNQAS